MSAEDMTPAEYHEAQAFTYLEGPTPSEASVSRANAHARLAASIRAGEIAGALRGIAEALGGAAGICGDEAPAIAPPGQSTHCSLLSGHSGWHGHDDMHWSAA